MKRSKVGGLNQSYLVTLQQKIAYHEAGHVTAIHFNNNLNGLPPAFYQIIFQDVSADLLERAFNDSAAVSEYIAKVEGGRLIKSLSDVTDRSAHYFNNTDDTYRLALEIDIVNLLIGPLAEAKYIAKVDGEPFRHQLITAEALKYYGGEADFAVVNEYLQRYSIDKQEQEDKLKQALMQAFHFVNDEAKWRSITAIADYILASNKTMISCEEVLAVLESKNPLTFKANSTHEAMDKNTRIAELAYYKAEQRGFAPGHELEDWLAAEQEYLYQIVQSLADTRNYPN